MAHLTKTPKLGISNSNDLYKSYLINIKNTVVNPIVSEVVPNVNESELQTAIATHNCLDMVEMPAQDSVQPHIVNPTRVAGISFPHVSPAPNGPKACIAALAAKPLLTHRPKKSVSNSAAT